MVSGCLPMDVLLDVLLRLPVKSLKRFECVSKSWKSLIRDPNFSKRHIEHMNKSSSTIKTKNHGFIVSYRPFDCNDTYLSLLFLDENTGSIVSFRWLNLTKYFKEGECMNLIGPVNGIYCVYSGDCTRIAMVNIALRELKVVSSPLLLLPTSLKHAVGLGFDHETNDYKVVVFNEFLSKGWIYSLRCDSWKDADCSTVPNHADHLPYMTCQHNQFNTYLDGKIHWLRYLGPGHKFIVYFDVVAEVFGQIDLPELISNANSVAVWNECLSVIDYHHHNCWHIWTIQDLGNKDDYSWTKLPINSSCKLNGLVEGFWRNGEILFQDFDDPYYDIVHHGLDIFSYDPSTQKSTRLFDAKLEFDQTLVYSESLVSVIGDERDERNMLFDVVDDHDIVDINRICRKIYVRGLTRETTQAQLIEHFRQFGIITNSIIMKDHTTGKSRGFGFVTFANSCAVDEVFKHELIYRRTHMINGKKLEVKQAIPRGVMGFKRKRKEIIVSGIPRSVREDEFKDFFSQFGEVKEHTIARYSSSGGSLGFGFITFHTEEAVGYLLGLGNKLDFAGVQVEIKRAE